MKSIARPLPCHSGSPGRYALPNAYGMPDERTRSRMLCHTPESPRCAAGLDGHGRKPGPAPVGPALPPIPDVAATAAAYCAFSVASGIGIFTDGVIWIGHDPVSPPKST